MHDPDSPSVPAALLQQLLHDLSAPVALVRHSAEYALLKYERGELKAGHLTRVRDAAGEIGRLLGTVSVWSQLARGGALQLSKKLMGGGELARVAAEAVENLAERPRARNVVVAVRRESFAALGPQEVEADGRWLALALGCVLDNAVRYSFPKTVVRVWARADGPGSLALGVENTGLLIHADEVEHCAEWTWRGREARHSSPRGFGLGLWATAAVMRAHRGRLRVNSAESGEGALTRVELVLPVVAGRGGDEVSDS